jgi:hypothetical protein
MSSLKIDVDTYPAIKKKNYFCTTTKKKQIVIATSLRKDHHHINRWKNSNMGYSKLWSTYTIGRNGVIYQHFPPEKYSEFIGVKSVDKRIISIVLENMGYLNKNKNDIYYNWLNEVCEKESVGFKKYLGYDYWEKISDEQTLSMINLINFLCDKHGISKTMIDFKNQHKDTHKFNGVVFRSNYVYDTNDINPFLLPNKINEMLHKGFI